MNTLLPALPATALRPARIESIDLLKGVVMVIMALDHVRDYFHQDAYFFDATDPAFTTWPLFLTRFITNFCAPAFSFLAGLSAFLVGRRKTRNELSVFLLKRGLWLIFVELVVMDFGWYFDIQFREVNFQVIWSLGISMIFLAGLLHLPRIAILVFSCVIIFGHNLLDGIQVEGIFLWALLHGRASFPIGPGHVVRAGYSLIPWVAVMSLGYWFGPFYNPSFGADARRKLFKTIGLSAVAFMLIIRGANVYGNALPWTVYDHFSQTVFSFLRLTKYPASLTFLLLTLGATLLFLANTEHLKAGLKGKVVGFFCVFGRVPFFYYIIHLYLIHVLALIVAEATGFGWQKMILTQMPFRTESLKGFGFDLPIVYAIWIGIILVLYPVCKKFDRYKQAHKEQWWLSYL
ncbi:DUF1624 domain-containing protein [Spirosoma areae]